MSATSRFSVAVFEGDPQGDVNIYFCDDEPTLVSKPVSTEGEDFFSPTSVVLVKFVPKNGSGLRVNKTNYVPFSRVVAIVAHDVGDKPGEWPFRGSPPEHGFSTKA